MRRITAAEPHHAILDAEGNVIEVGDGDVELQDESHAVVWFATRAARETDPDIALWRLNRGKVRRLVTDVEDQKSEAEYAGKAAEAVEWVKANKVIELGVEVLPDVGDYTEEKYPWLSLDVEIAGKTPKETAQSILSAMKRTDPDDLGSWERARLRTIVREQLKDD